MIISHSKKFIFIHIYKVAGTSISTALRKYNHTKSKKNRLFSILRRYPHIFVEDFPTHIPASALRKNLPEKIFNSYYKFAFVRNPWDWQVSLYHFAKQNLQHHQHHIIKNMDFETYLEWRVNTDLKLQKDFVMDEGSNLIVDFIGQIESIQRDFFTIRDRLGLNCDKLPMKNISHHHKYSKYYNTKTKKLVEEAFSEDIALFGYDYEK